MEDQEYAAIAEIDSAPSSEIVESSGSEESSAQTDDSSSGFLDGLFGVDPDSEPASEEATETVEETAVTEEKPAVVDDLEDAPKGMTAKNQEGWKTLKSAKREIEKERDNLRREIEELKKTPVAPQSSEDIATAKQELETARAQLAEYDRNMALVNVEKTREYQENIAAPLANAENMIQAFATKYELSIPEIAQAAMNPNMLERNQALADMVGGMNDFDKFEFKKVVDEAQSLFQRSQSVKQNAVESLKFVESQRQVAQSKTAAKQQEAANAAADMVWESFSKKLPFLQDDPKLASQLNKDAREADIVSATPEIQKYASYAGVVLPKVMEKYNNAVQTIAKLEAALAKRSSASPQARSGSVPSVKTNVADDFMAGLDAVL
jgi:hypothetical protein